MSRTYQELIDACTINYELFRGDISNRGTTNMGASIVAGSPQFQRRDKTVNLVTTSRTVSQGFSSALTTRIVDVTTQFVVEFAITFGALSQYVLYQVQGGGLGGGTSVYFDGVSTLYLFTFTAAVGNARFVNCVVPNPLAFTHHYVMWLDPVGLAGQIWIDNIPVTTTFTNTNPPVNGVSGLYVMARSPAIQSLNHVRVWQGAVDDAERRTLFDAYSTLTVPSRL